VKYKDPATRAAAQRALYNLRMLLESFKEICTHARINNDHERQKWAEESIARARADIVMSERDLSESER